MCDVCSSRCIGAYVCFNGLGLSARGRQGLGAIRKGLAIGLGVRHYSKAHRLGVGARG